MNCPSPIRIAELASQRAFGSPLVTNVNRGLVAEAVIAAAICPEWTWCSQDYFAYDFSHPSGARLEVKQSAARQSWPTKKASLARWDIAARDGRWEGDVWIPSPGRNADVYVMCWHSMWTDDADHRDPAQWAFFVIAAGQLPTAKTMGMSSAKRLSTEVGFSGLADAVRATLASLLGKRAERPLPIAERGTA